MTTPSGHSWEGVTCTSRAVWPPPVDCEAPRSSHRESPGHEPGVKPRTTRRVVHAIPFNSESGREPRAAATGARSEEHTSELQSQSNLVCRLLLEKKKYPLPPQRSRDRGSSMLAEAHGYRISASCTTLSIMRADTPSPHILQLVRSSRCLTVSATQ